MSFSAHLLRLQLASSLEQSLRARFDARCTHQFVSSQVLPVHDMRLQAQSTLLSVTMQNDTAKLYMLCKQTLDERAQRSAPNAVLEEALFDNDGEARSDIDSTKASRLMLNALGALLDGRFYNTLRNHFGAVYVYSDAYTHGNVMALKNSFDRRDQPVLLLHFEWRGGGCGRADDERNSSAAAAASSNESQDLRLISGALNRSRYSLARASRVSSDWLQRAWQRTKRAVQRR